MGNLGLSELLVLLVFFALYVWSVVSVYRDAERRGKSGVLVALLVALVAWPLGCLVWLLVRPSGGGAGVNRQGGRVVG